MRTLRNLPRLVVGALILLLGIAPPALAEVFCVNNAASLQTALTTAASNGVDDEVRIVQSTYVGNFVYTSSEAQALSVPGGYTTGCADRTLDPVNTILDGNQTGTVLKLSAPDVAAVFLVEGLTLRKGIVSGLSAVAGPGGVVLVDNNFISENSARSYSANPEYDYNGGGVLLRATTAGLSNNDITGNSAYYYGGGVYMIATTATLTSNNISNNIASFYYSSSYGAGGVYLIATTATVINNNISGNTASGVGGGIYFHMKG